MSLSLLGACRAAPPPQKEASASASAPTPAASSGAVQSYGASIPPRNTTKLADVLQRPQDFSQGPVTVEGHVRRVCKKMGCWMELAESSARDAQSCRVFFGAHSFFLPTDSDGATARVQATVEVKRVDPKFVNHLEEEGAIFENKDEQGGAQEVRLVASGVELTKG